MIKIINPNKAILLIFLLFCCERNTMISIPRIKNTVCRFINKKFWLTVKDNITPNNPRIKIRIKLSRSIEFQKILMFISSICFELIDRLEFSARGELEITDLNNLYIKSKNVSFKTLNDWWIDAGTEDRIEELKKLI